MQEHNDSGLEELWEEYAQVFREFDDLTLARWMSQTLGQLAGRVWRASHPLVSAYRAGGMVAHERQLWLKRLANKPAAFEDAPCCRAPLVPFFTRDAAEAGLLCLHCGETVAHLNDLPLELKNELTQWAADYARVHQVAHWDERAQRRAGDYEAEFDRAGSAAEELLLELGAHILPRLLNQYPAVVWEDHDECLDVRPEDILP